MNTTIDFSSMVFFDFYSLNTNKTENGLIVMSDDCYMCQECYYR